MPRVATTINISNPKRYGYDVRIDDILLRSAVGPGREMQIQSSDVQEGQINVKQNPEDFTSNLGRIYSRNNFTGGQGLDTAHRANGSPKDTTRFFDSKGVDVFHGDDETSYHTHLLYTTESKLTFSIAFIFDTGRFSILENSPTPAQCTKQKISSLFLTIFDSVASSSSVFWRSRMWCI